MASFQNELYQKDKQQLLNIFFEKGNNRKAALHEATQHQTRDWAATEQALYDMQSQLENLQAQKQAYLDSQSRQSERSREIAARIDELNGEIATQRADIGKQESGASTSRYIEKMREAESALTKQDIIAINKLLGDESPDALVTVLEHFVALLRNKPNSKPVDVELFMKDHAKLIAKMAKTPTNSCALSIVRPAKEAITEVAQAFDVAVPNEIDLTKYKVFVEWSLNFCDAAEIDMKKDDMKETLDKLSAEKDIAERERENIQKKMQDAQNLNFVMFFDNAIRNIQLRIQEMEKIVSMDREQATAYQQNLKNFENSYFDLYLRRANE